MRGTAIAVALVLGASPAGAYAPGAATLLQRMASSQEQDAPRRLAARAAALQITLHYPGRCTLRRGEEVAQRNDLGVSTNSAAPDLRLLAEYACELVALRGAPRAEAEAWLTRFLERRGIDPTVTSLGRIAGRVAYVIGAAPGQLDRPQLWIDRDLYLPLRLVALDADAWVDVQLVRYPPPGLGHTFPLAVRILRGGVEQLSVVAEEVVPNPPEEPAPPAQ